MRILILGSGPAALFAAHAAEMRGHDVMIMSKPRKSFMHGAQYLHRPIPGLSTSESFQIDYRLTGSIDGYRDKVYAGIDRRAVRVSPQDLLGRHEAWDIREAYDAAWELYGDQVVPLELVGERGEVRKLLEWAKPDLMISTVPAPLLCEDPGHGFTSETVWATDKSFFLLDTEDNVVVCSGEKDHAWYRQSRIQGCENTEYPNQNKPPFPQGKVWEVVKPVATTCTCYPEVMRLGRYGLWEKGVLSDGAYYSTEENLTKLEEARLW